MDKDHIDALNFFPQRTKNHQFVNSYEEKRNPSVFREK